MLAQYEGRYAAARQLHQEALRIAREVVNRRATAMALLRLADAELFVGQYEQADALYAESLAIFRSINYQRDIAMCLIGQAMLAIRRSRSEEGAQIAKHALTIARSIDDQLTIGVALRVLGVALAMCGDIASGERYLEEAIASCEAIGAIPDALEAAVELAAVLLYHPARFPDQQGVPRMSRRERALDLLTEAERHPALRRSARERAVFLRASV
jgi:tetratricopeptide (TPR) repeat protein